MVGRGDILFLVSCSEIVKKDIRMKFRHTLVLHASSLPKGRGWSPHIWEILNGADQIVISLLEAEDKIDSGDGQNVVVSGDLSSVILNAELDDFNTFLNYDEDDLPI